MDLGFKNLVGVVRTDEVNTHAHKSHVHFFILGVGFLTDPHTNLLTVGVTKVNDFLGDL